MTEAAKFLKRTHEAALCIDEARRAGVKIFLTSDGGLSVKSYWKGGRYFAKRVLEHRAEAIELLSRE